MTRIWIRKSRADFLTAGVTMESSIREIVWYAEIKLLVRFEHGDVSRQLEVRRPW